MLLLLCGWHLPVCAALAGALVTVAISGHMAITVTVLAVAHSGDRLLTVADVCQIRTAS